VPVQRIWLDTAESGDVPVPQTAGQLDPETSSSLHSMYRYLVHDLRLTAQEARQRLQLIEPFNQHPDVIQALPDIQ
jgi:hypothetical protein